MPLTHNFAILLLVCCFVYSLVFTAGEKKLDKRKNVDMKNSSSSLSDEEASIAIALLEEKIKLLNEKMTMMTSSAENETETTNETIDDVVAAASANVDNNDDDDIPFVKEMMERGLVLSVKQQRKFYPLRNLPYEFFVKEELNYNRYEGKNTARGRVETYGYLLNQDFAFRHIYKSGGTTVEFQTKSEDHATDKEVGNRTVITTVRDPIDHFLAGWQECGTRYSNLFGIQPTNQSSDEEYNARINEWIDIVEERAGRSRRRVGCNGAKLCHCSVHSYPQANYFIEPRPKVGETNWDQRIKMVADLRELPKVLEMVGFPYNYTEGSARQADDDPIKKKFYPRRKEAISDVTMRRICKFVSLDYLFFDYPLPEACK